MRLRFVLPATLICIMVAFLISLGFWQLDRADEKRAIESAIEVANTGDIEFIDAFEGLEYKEYFHLRIKGRYLPERQFIYDNQIVQQASGYYVLTPFVIDGSENAILINRGFVPWHGRRDQLADISVDNAQKQIQVQIDVPVKRLELSHTELSGEFPILVQSLDLSLMGRVSGLEIAPVMGLLSAESDDGFVRQWQPYVGSIGKHLGYAVQWFAMALVLSIIGIRLGIKHIRSR